MKIGVITSNPGKVAEYQSEFEHFGIRMEHLPIHYDEVQTSDLEEVVKKGLIAISEQGRIDPRIENFLIDDSGLFIDHLKGFPGVWSAYAQKTIGNKGILKLMDGVSNRSARFKCCIGCVIEGRTIIVTGECEGCILEEERGNEGFGFDPIFSYDGKISFAEISMEKKNSISHRGNAVKLLIDELKNILQ